MNALLYQLSRPWLFRMDPETAHHRALAMLERLSHRPGLLRLLRRKPPVNSVELFGLTFPNRIGLAAGFDKNAVALPAWEALGFGFVEIGTVTAHGQPGNPRPRIFRLVGQEAVINRLGFNNDGADVVAARLNQWREQGLWPHAPVGINIGKSKITPLEEAVEDYLESFNKLAGHADYITINVSSPNTPGLRDLQEKPALNQLLEQLHRRNLERERPVPLLLKVAPDLEPPQLDDILELTEQHDLAGLIATNTTIDHQSIPEALRETGGLSGRPLLEKSTAVLAYLAQRTNRPLIAAGGIMDEAGARAKLDAGARLLQVYTGFVYKGPALIHQLAAL